MNKKCPVIITGGTGLIGRYIARDLAEDGYKDITLVSRSGSVPQALQSKYPFIKGVQADVRDRYPLDDIIPYDSIVIHTAAMVSYDPKMKSKMMEANISGTANIVNICLDKNVAQLIHISSTAAIGRGKDALSSETTEWEDSPFNNSYSISKHQSELEVWRGQEEGLDVLILNPGIILGSGSWKNSSLKIYDQMYKGLSYYPTGGTGVVDVRDVARFIMLGIKKNLSGNRYILVGANVSYEKLFSDISKRLGQKPPHRKISPIMEYFAVAAERIRALVRGKSPVITKQSLRSARHRSVYDVSKSLSVQGFSYIDYDQTIQESCQAYLDKSTDLLPMVP